MVSANYEKLNSVIVPYVSEPKTFMPLSVLDVGFSY